MPRRAWKRRRWPTPTSRSRTTSRSSRSSTRSICPGAQPDEAKRQIEEIIGLDSSGAILASAKEGTGVHEILEAIVTRLPPPTGDPDAPLKALIFDSWYDAYRGVIILTRVIDGVIRAGHEDPADGQGAGVRRRSGRRVLAQAGGRDRARASARSGSSSPGSRPSATRRSATRSRRPRGGPRRRFRASRSASRWSSPGCIPVEGSEYPQLRDALEKLRLNDASFFCEPETSAALGFGFRCGFLGLLHMEIVQERLEREFGMDLVTTAPGVLYRVTTTDGVVQEIDSPSKLPDTGRIEKIEEPIITAMMLTPAEHVGAILQLCQEKRGVQKSIEYLAAEPRAGDLRAAVQRGRDGLLRSAENDFPRLRLARLPCDRVPGSAAGEARHPRERGAGGRALDHRPPRHGVPARPRAGVEDARAHPAADVRDRDPGGHRQPHHRARVGQGAAQERAGEVLRRRHLAQAQAPREAEGREEADEARRPRRDSAGSVPGGAEGGDGADDISEIHRSRVLRVDRHRGDPRAVRAHLGGAGLQDPDRVDGEQPAHRRSPAREQVRLRADGDLARSATLLPVRDIRRRRRRRVQVPGRAGARFHQARDRAAGRDAGAPEQEGLHQRPAARRAVRALPGAGLDRAGSHVVRRPRAVRPGAGARGAVSS